MSNENTALVRNASDNLNTYGGTSGSSSISLPSETQNCLWNVELETRKTWPVKLASFCVCLVVTIGVFVYCFFEHTLTEYEVDHDIRKELMRNKSATIICYKKVENSFALPLLYNLSLGLLGVIISTIVDRLCLVAEEFRHISTRYDGSKWKMLKACFSGIQWGAVIALVFVLIIVNIVYPFLVKAKFDWKYIVYVFSGMGVGPLIMQLLNLNTQSEVHISAIVEKKENYNAYALAWSYYANTLKCILPSFNTKATEFTNEGRLSCNKLLVLVSNNALRKNLTELDNTLQSPCPMPCGNEYSSTIYSFKIDENEYRYCMEYATEPLKALNTMGSTESEGIRNRDVKYHIKLLCKVLNDILSRRENEELRNMCVIIPITQTECHDDGKLARAIHNKVKGKPIPIDMASGQHPSSETPQPVAGSSGNGSSEPSMPGPSEGIGNIINPN